MDSSRNGRLIIPFKKLKMLRVKIFHFPKPLVQITLYILAIIDNDKSAFNYIFLRTQHIQRFFYLLFHSKWKLWADLCYTNIIQIINDLSISASGQ